MSEREGQVPIIVQITEAAKKYAEDEVEETDIFSHSVDHLARKMGSSQNPEAYEVAKGLVKHGIQTAATRIGLLPAFSNPESRKEIVEKLKKDKVEGAWVGILANWNVSADPYGVGVIRRCKDKDIEEILQKTKEAENDNQKAQILLQAEAIAIGQDLIIEFYNQQITSPAKIAA